MLPLSRISINNQLLGLCQMPAEMCPYIDCGAQSLFCYQQVVQVPCPPCQLEADGISQYFPALILIDDNPIMPSWQEVELLPWAMDPIWGLFDKCFVIIRENETSNKIYVHVLVSVHLWTRPSVYFLARLIVPLISCRLISIVEDL